MFSIIKNDSRFPFMAKSGFFMKLSLVAFLISLVLLLVPGIPGVGLKFGLDFSGGHEILVSFEGDTNIGDVRNAVESLGLGDAAVQSYEVPESSRTHYLVRVQRSATFGEAELAQLRSAFAERYGKNFRNLEYNAEAGDVVDVELVATSTTEAAGVDTSSAAIGAVVEKTDHDVRLVRKIGRPDQMKFSVVLKGVDVSVVNVLRDRVHPSARTDRVGFVGPTVGRQLRNDGIVACVYALLMILVYIALRFDFLYAPPAVICLFHDAVITAGILALIGHEFSLTTVAGLLTLIGYSINDTIVVFDRVRERVGKAQGSQLAEVLDRAINETLGRTIMTSLTTLFSCLCLLWFGRNTVLFDFGVIMSIGLVIGCYSTVFIASPIFLALRNRFGEKLVVGAAPSRKEGGKATHPAS